MQVFGKWEGSQRTRRGSTQAQRRLCSLHPDRPQAQGSKPEPSKKQATSTMNRPHHKMKCLKVLFFSLCDTDFYLFLARCFHFVCQQDYAKSIEPICINFSGGIRHVSPRHPGLFLMLFSYCLAFAEVCTSLRAILSSFSRFFLFL